MGILNTRPSEHQNFFFLKPNVAEYTRDPSTDSREAEGSLWGSVVKQPHLMDELQAGEKHYQNPRWLKDTCGQS